MEQGAAPVPARELLPERALLGDTSAVAALYNDVTRPLADAGPALSETLDAYLDSGGAIEACARKLFVHPNTVRYRLKRIADFTGRDPTVPRDACPSCGSPRQWVGWATSPLPAGTPRPGTNAGGDSSHPIGGTGPRGLGRGTVSLTSHHWTFCWVSTKPE